MTSDEIVSKARTANLVAFAGEGIAVLDQEGTAGAAYAIFGEHVEPKLENTFLWDELTSEAASAGILKYSARRLMVLVW